MNLLSSLLTYTARQIAALRSKDSNHEGRLTTAESSIATLASRIENAISAVTTSTEVTDIRVGDDNVIYTTAGEAVRKQFSTVKNELDEVFIDEAVSQPEWTQGYINNSNGSTGSDPASCVSYAFPAGDYYVTAGTGYKKKVAQYAVSDNAFQGIVVSLSTGSTHVEVPEGSRIRIQVTKDNGTLAPSSVDDSVLSISRRIYTDTTLTQAGKIADAKAVGDAFKSGARKQITVEMEGNILENDGSGYGATQNDQIANRRTAYFIKTYGATRLYFDDLDNYDGSYIRVFFYDSDMQYLSSVQYGYSGFYSIGISDPNCEYVKFYIHTTQKIHKFSISLEGATKAPEQVKNIVYRGVGKYGTEEPFSERINFAIKDSSSTASENNYTTARLLLPPNYTVDGDKTPLILWLDGSGSFQTWDNNFPTLKIPYLRYLRDEGFAVFGIYAWGKNYNLKYPSCGMSYPYPVPTTLKFVREGIKYLCDHYNIDPDNVHIMSKSQGGQCALYYASHPEFPVRSIGMFSPVLDYLSMPGENLYADTRKAIAEDMGFTGDTEYFGSTDFLAYSEEGKAFFRENKLKIIGMNEAYTDLIGDGYDTMFEQSLTDCEKFWTDQSASDIYTHNEYVKLAKVPVKIWGAVDDAATPYLKMAEVIEQLRNGGTEAVLRTYNANLGGHGAPDIDGPKIASITTSLGITHTNVTTGWVENVEWIRQHMAK